MKRVIYIEVCFICALGYGQIISSDKVLEKSTLLKLDTTSYSLDMPKLKISENLGDYKKVKKKKKSKRKKRKYDQSWFLHHQEHQRMIDNQHQRMQQHMKSVQNRMMRIP